MLGKVKHILPNGGSNGDLPIRKKNHPKNINKSKRITGDGARILWSQGIFVAFWRKPNLQWRYNTPLEHTRTNPPRELWKEFLYSLLVKVGFSGCAPKEPSLNGLILDDQ